MNKELIEKMVELEWEMFSATQNEGGQASCQRDKRSFVIMRSSQFAYWDDASLRSYHADLLDAKAAGMNLPTLKYAYMMESTDPAAYARIASALPALSDEKREMVEKLVAQTIVWCEEFAARWPNVASCGRSIRSSTDSVYNTSVETYSRGEFSSYGMETLRCLLRHYESMEADGVNLHEKIVEREVMAQGATSLEAAEKMMARR